MLRVASALAVVLTSVAAAQPTSSATSPPPLPLPATTRATTTPSTNPADVARVAALGGIANVSLHDPSTVVRSGDAYYAFSTGVGIKRWRSRDLKTWTALPPVFARPLPWLAEAVPGQRGHLWAPDVIRVDDAEGERWLLYYSVSAFGKNRSAIALATSRTLDPDDPRHEWIDRGIVVRSMPNETNYNAIDPSVLRTEDGRLWMAFGSFWSGHQLIELDPATGMRKGDAITRVAWKPQIEAPTLHRRGRWFYQFVNWGFCCRGTSSTYEIRVGRSERIEGPYIDRDGVELTAGGGTAVLASDGPFVGPGHAGIVVAPDGTERLTGHFYDGADNGRAKLFVRPLTWDADGWPTVGRPEQSVDVQE